MSFIQLVKDIVSPDTCCICGEVKKDFFDTGKILFHGKKSSIESPFCQSCTRRLSKSYTLSRRKIPGTHCFGISLFDFADETVKNLIYHIKKQNCTVCKQFFAKILEEPINELIPEKENCTITYIPRSIVLHQKYAYDQSEEVVRTFVLNNSWPKFCDIFYRDKNYKLPQKNLGVKARFFNAKMSLKLKESPNQDDTIIVIDDMVTTGATASAAYSLLKRSGASDIYFLFMAGTAKFEERRTKDNE